MLLKSAVVLSLIVLAHAALIQRNIPVEVKYDEISSNLDEKLRNEVPAATAKTSREAPDLPVEIRVNGVKNLDEKVQLSLQDLSQASKHLPVVEEISLKELDAKKSDQESQEPLSIQAVLQQAEDIIFSGLKRLRNSFKADKDQKAPNAQQWDDFERAVNEYLVEQKNKLQLKQEQPAQPPQNQNIFQNIAQGFQQVANNFVQNLVGSQGSNTTSDEQQQQQQGSGPFGGFVNFFQNGKRKFCMLYFHFNNFSNFVTNQVIIHFMHVFG